MKTTGFVLVRESFDYKHDYAIIAYSESKEELEKFPVETGANYIFPITSDPLEAIGTLLKNPPRTPRR